MELEKQISEILGGFEPLDSLNFDAIEFINMLFPTEQSFSTLDSVLGKLRGKMNLMDRDMRETLRFQTDCDAERAELDNARETISKLESEMRAIKEKAKHAELTVQLITKDIKTLDCAKKNLTSTITVLKRLQMLASAVDQLRLMVSKRQFNEVASLLLAVNQLSANFATFKNVKQVNDLLDGINSCKSELKRMIFGDFEGSFTQQGAFTGNAMVLNDACKVIDVLNPEVKVQLLDWYCELQLREYKSVFRTVDEVGSLENLPRRLAWLKRVIKAYDEEHAAIFIPQWAVSEIVCTKFCNITKDDIGILLSEKPNTDVKLLVKYLGMILEFETGLNKRFTALRGSECTDFTRIISVSFDPYMHLYIEAEDRALAEMIDKFRSKQKFSDDDVQENVFITSTDVFLFYKNTLKSLALLTNRKPYLDLSRLFGKYLCILMDVLTMKLSKEDKRPATADEIKITCYIMNTADYCSSMASQLEEKIKATIDAEFKDQVSFEKEQDSFLVLSTASVQVLVRQVNTCCAPAFNTMTKIQWGTMQSVGDQSEYVSNINGAIINYSTSIRKTCRNIKHFKWFCDKFVDAFVPWFLKNIHACKPISEVGAEQMLLDSHAIKTVLLSIPTLGSDERDKTPPSAMYTKFVTKGMAKAETLLKAVLSPLDPAEMMIKNFMILNSEGMEFDEKNIAGNQQKIVDLRTEFVKILDLKGVKKVDQQNLVDLLMKRISSTLGAPSLTGTSSAVAYASTAPFAAPSGFSSIASGFASISQSAASSVVPPFLQNTAVPVPPTFPNAVAGNNSPALGNASTAPSTGANWNKKLNTFTAGILKGVGGGGNSSLNTSTGNLSNSSKK